MTDQHEKHSNPSHRRRPTQNYIRLMSVIVLSLFVLVLPDSSYGKTLKCPSDVSSCTPLTNISTQQQRGPHASLNRPESELRLANQQAQTNTPEHTGALATCTKNYHNQLSSINASYASRLQTAIELAKTTEASTTGRWTFFPTKQRTKKSQYKRKCVKWRRTWSYEKGRYRSKCVRSKRVKITSDVAQTQPPQKVSKEEKEIFRLAALFVRARGKDPELDQGRTTGWIAHRISSDLQTYLNQSQNPTICTGTLEMADFFEKNFETVRLRATTIKKAMETAKNLTVKHASSIREKTYELPTGHPGFGAAPLSLRPLNLNETLDLKNLLEIVANSIGTPEVIENVENALSDFEALREIKAVLRSKNASETDEGLRQTIIRTLSLAEAVLYLNLVNGKYGELQGAIDGSLSAIRKAYSQHCTCQS